MDPHIILVHLSAGLQYSVLFHCRKLEQSALILLLVYVVDKLQSENNIFKLNKIGLHLYSRPTS